MPTRSVQRVINPRPNYDLVGSLRTVGELGPGYQVVSIDSATMATIVMLETEEEVSYPIFRILDDPEA